MRICITQFTDVEALKTRLATEFASNPNDVQVLLAFVDDVKHRMERMQSVNASIQLEKTFKISRENVSVKAGIVHGFFPTLWARLFK